MMTRKDDCISRDEVCRYVAEFVNHEFSTREEEELIDNIITGIEHMPSVTPQEPQSFKWCTDCKEYDQEKHCCHRYSKVIRDTVAEIRQEPVLDKLRAEIERQEKWLMDAGYNAYNVDIAFNAVKLAVDKYRAETEEENVSL